MKITIEPLQPGAEEEIVIRANSVDEELLRLIREVSAGRTRLTGFLEDGGITVVEPKTVYYFESVDNRVYAYGEKEVNEVRAKLYELEQTLGGDFLRVSKSVIVNLKKVRRLTPSLNGRFEALLKNGEKVVISRQYVPELKRHFGL